jgi:xanthine dehydrogenase YagR molybdenum-binding subunit
MVAEALHHQIDEHPRTGGLGGAAAVVDEEAQMVGHMLRQQGDVRLGDSNFPVSAGSGGQWGAASSTAGVYAACVKLREAVAQKLGINPADATFSDGQVRSGGQSVPLGEAAGQGDSSPRT